MSNKIEWCDKTLNPLGYGCYGPGGTAEKPKICPYCYAFRLAKRGLRECELCKKFVPHTHFEQLEKLKLWKKPQNIFIESMGDLFHDSIPDEWIQEVFNACKAAPQHNYLFLTKNPKRYADIAYCGNVWLGNTITKQDDFIREYGRPHGANRFYSIEPLLGQVVIPQINIPKWVIIGQQTGPGAIPPKPEWVQAIIDQCKAAGVPVFVKSPLYSQFPIQEWPEGLRR